MLNSSPILRAPLRSEMIMKTRYLFTIGLLVPLLAQAEIYKSVDENGHVTYSNSPLKGGRKIVAAPNNHGIRYAERKNGAHNTPSPGNFPKIDRETQKNRDGSRQRILQNELENEEKLLIEARKNLKEVDGNRADPKRDDKLKALLVEIKVHEKNIEALNTELSKLK